MFGKNFDLGKNKDSFFFLSLFVIYSVCHIWSLLHPGIYWDDWVLIGIKPELVRDDFFRNGRPFFGLLHEALLHLPYTIFSYKILIFLTNFVAVWLFFEVLKKISHFEKNEVYLLTLLFTVLPYNSARYSIVILQYAVCLVLFLIGVLYWLRTDTKWFHRLVIFVCLVLSMYIEAFLAFLAAIVILFEVFKIKKIKSNPEVLAAIIFFLFLRYVVHPPQDIYASLNSIQLKKVLLSPLYLLQSFKVNFVSVLSEALSKILRYATLISFIFALPFAYLIVNSRMDYKNIRTDRSVLYKAAIGFLLFVCVTLPFIVVNKGPTNSDWQTRSQFLLPVACGLILLYGIYLVFKSYVQKWILLLLVFVSINLNVSYGFEYFFDYLKQESLILHFKKNEALRNNTTFIVEDSTESMNARGRTFRMYEYTGLFKKAFNDEKRMAYRIHEPPVREDIEFGYMKEFNNLKDYQWAQPDHRIKIWLGAFRPQLAEDGLALIWAYFLHSIRAMETDTYNRLLLKLVRVSVLSDSLQLKPEVSEFSKKNYSDNSVFSKVGDLYNEESEFEKEINEASERFHKRKYFFSLY